MKIKPFIPFSFNTLALIAFLLPFVVMKCNKNTVTEISGYDIMVGIEDPSVTFQEHLQQDIGSFFGGFIDMSIESEMNSHFDEITENQNNSRLIIAAAATFSFLSIIFFFITFKSKFLLSSLFSLLSVISLISFSISIKDYLGNMFTSNVLWSFEINLAIGFYLCIVFGTIATLGYAFIHFDHTKSSKLKQDGQ